MTKPDSQTTRTKAQIKRAIKAQERVIRDLNDQLADACSGMKALSAELRNANSLD